MQQEIRASLLQSIARQFALSTLNGRQRAIYFLFGLLLVLVILTCAVSPSPFLAVALIAALVVVVFAIMYPPVALLLVFLGTGLPSILLPLPGHTLHMAEAPLLLCLLIWIFRRAHLRLRLPHLLALLFLSIAVVSFIHVPDVSTAINIPGASKELIELTGIFLAFFCGTALARYIKNPSSFLSLALLTNIPLYLIGLAQALSIHIPALLESSSAQDPKQSLGRLWGPSPWPSTFGMYLINLFSIALACLLLGTSKRDRMIGAIMTVVTTLEIIGSGTISVTTAAIILTIVAFIATRRVKWLLGIFTVSGVIALINLGRLLPRFIHNDTSNRLILWQESVKLIAAYPLFGIGLYQFPRYMTQTVASLQSGLAVGKLEPLEQYLEWAVESGIVWGMIGVLLLLSITYSCWKAYRLAQRKHQAVLLAATLAMVANIYIGFFDVPFDQVEGPIFLCLLAGLALGYAEYIRWGNPQQKRTGYPWQILRLRALHSTAPGEESARLRARRPSAALPAPAQSLQSTRGGSAAPLTAPESDEITREVLPDVSIIVPATRVEKASRTLESIFHLRYEGKMEIIVVGPVVDALAHLWADKLAQGWTVIALFHELTRPAGKLRNFGVTQATGGVLLFLDDDITVDQDWVTRSVRALQEPKVGIIGTRLPGKSAAFFARCFDFTNFCYYQNGKIKDGPVASSCMGILRSAFFAVGGFDNTHFSGEDIDLCYRVQEKGYRTVYRGDIVAIHDHGYETFSNLLRNNYWRGRTAGLRIKIRHKNKELKNRLLYNVRFPLLFLLLLPFIAASVTVRIVAMNVSEKPKVLLYAPFISLAKLFYEFGVFQWTQSKVGAPRA